MSKYKLTLCGLMHTHTLIHTHTYTLFMLSNTEISCPLPVCLFKDCGWVNIPIRSRLEIVKKMNDSLTPYGPEREKKDNEGDTLNSS